MREQTTSSPPEYASVQLDRPYGKQRGRPTASLHTGDSCTKRAILAGHLTIIHPRYLISAPSEYTRPLLSIGERGNCEEDPLPYCQRAILAGHLTILHPRYLVSAPSEYTRPLLSARGETVRKIRRPIANGRFLYQTGDFCRTPDDPPPSPSCLSFPKHAGLLLPALWETRKEIRRLTANRRFLPDI